MAPFRWPDDAERLDFELLRETSVSLYFSREIVAEYVEWLRQHGYAVCTFDCSGWTSEEAFHIAVPHVLFPAYKGRNLTAFNDWICRLDLPEDGGAALVFVSFHSFFKVAPEGAWHLLDIIAKWSRFFLLTGKRLIALVQSDDEGIRGKLKPVGARPVLLNRPEKVQRGRERLYQVRRTWADADGPHRGGEAT